MAWQDKYIEIVEKIGKLKDVDSVGINNVQDSLNDIVVQINSHKSNLVEQLNDQEVEATEENSLTELIEMIEEIEGGGETPDYDFLANIEEIRQGEIKVEDYIFKTFLGEGMEGEFPVFRNLKTLGGAAFSRSVFAGEFPVLPNIEEIERTAFSRSLFTGEFPMLPKIKEIGYRAFASSTFTGEFPYMERLTIIGEGAFASSNFDKDEDGFVKNYPGWNGRGQWVKPTAYRSKMINETPPKLMTILAPGAGPLEVYDDVQGERARKYLENNEPSDINYYLEYTKKLKEIGFERDKFGNYIDMKNDRSVIIIPEDIKFLV